MLNITDVTQPGRSGRLHHQTDDSRKQTQGPQTSHHFSSICLCSHSYLPTRGSKVQIIGLGTINISWAPNPVLSIETTKIYFEDKKKIQEVLPLSSRGVKLTLHHGQHTAYFDLNWAKPVYYTFKPWDVSISEKKEVHFQQNVSVFLHDKEILLQ